MPEPNRRKAAARSRATTPDDRRRCAADDAQAAAFPRAVDLSSLPRGRRARRRRLTATSGAQRTSLPARELGSVDVGRAERSDPASRLPRGTPERRAATPARTRRRSDGVARPAAALERCGGAARQVEHGAPRERHARAAAGGGDLLAATPASRTCRSAGRPASAPPRRAACRAAAGRSKPVAITVIFTCPSSVGSTTAPKMMLASSCAASWMMADASLTSIERQVAAAGHVDDDAARAVHRRVLEQRARDRARWRRPSARFSPFGDARAHHREPHAGHDRLHVGEVEVDQPGHQDQVRDALDRLPQHVVGGRERVGQRRRPRR